MQLSICIVNYNSSHLLEACLNSILANPPQTTFEIIVVDNQSADGIDQLPSRFPSVKFLRNECNAGFAVANNQAFEVAAGDDFLLLNPDTEVYPSSIDALLTCRQSFDGVGLVAAKLLDPDGTPQVGFNIRRLPTLLAATAQLLLLDELLPDNPISRRAACRDLDYEIPQFIEQPAASALLFPRAVWARVGGFDPRFVNWYNDVDLCKRVIDRGWSILFCPAARVLHHRGMGSAARPVDEGVVETYRALRLYFLKHHGWIAYNILNVLIVAGMVLRIVAVKTMPRIHQRVFTRAVRTSVSLGRAFRAVLWDTLTSWRRPVLEVMS